MQEEEKKAGRRPEPRRLAIYLGGGREGGSPSSLSLLLDREWPGLGLLGVQLEGPPAELAGGVLVGGAGGCEGVHCLQFLTCIGAEEHT